MYGLKIGSNCQNGLSSNFAQKKMETYCCDIVYDTTNEFQWDILRDKSYGLGHEKIEVSRL